MKYKVGDRVYWNGRKWEIFLIWNNIGSSVESCCLLDVLTGDSADTLVSTLKPIKTCK
nr:MAG TPA: protein of unknown function DUF3599 [Caudoviricetes sp.]